MECSGATDLRRRLKTGIARALDWPPLSKLISRCPGAGNLPFIAGYHRVVEEIDPLGRQSIPAQFISRRMLEKHLDWLGRRFRLVSLDELGEQLQSEAPFRRPLASITFDDGYSDVYEHAFPMLLRKGIPAAVFVVTGLVGTSRPYLHDRLYQALRRFLADDPRVRPGLRSYLDSLGMEVPAPRKLAGGPLSLSTLVAEWLGALPQERVLGLIEALEGGSSAGSEAVIGMRSMSWEMLGEMSRAGMTIGSHTRTHVLLTNETEPMVLEEVAGSRADLASKLGIEVNHFAYPCGRFDNRTVAAVASAGYRFAYTTCRHRDPQHPLLTIPRKSLWEDACLDGERGFSGAILSCQVNWVFDFLTGCRQNHAGTPLHHAL